MIDLLADNPLLLLFVVAATGYVVGRIRIGEFSLGIAAVLFSGIAFGALDPSLQLPEELWNLGLVLFVYTVGLATGPGFVASFRRRGLAANGGLVAAVAAAAGVAIAAETVLGLTAQVAAGVFTGATTNTPALAAALEYIRNHGGGESTEPVVGYSLTYPIGVLLPMLAVFLLMRSRPATSAAPGRGPTTLLSRTVRVDVEGLPSFGDLRAQLGGVTFGRVKRDGETMLADGGIAPRPGDLVSVVGDAAHVRHATAELGHESEHHIELERIRLRRPPHPRLEPRRRRAPRRRARPAAPLRRRCHARPPRRRRPRAGARHRDRARRPGPRPRAARAAAGRDGVLRRLVPPHRRDRRADVQPRHHRRAAARARAVPAPGRRVVRARLRRRAAARRARARRGRAHRAARLAAAATPRT